MTRDVDIAGGAATVRQALAAAAIDELVLDVVPVLLGRGERLFDGVADPGSHAGRGQPLTVCNAHPVPGGVTRRGLPSADPSLSGKRRCR